MGTLIINDNKKLENNLSNDEVFLLLSISASSDVDETKQSLINKGYIVPRCDKDLNPIGWKLSSKGKCAIQDITVPTKDTPIEAVDEGLEALAQSLKDMFPKGKRPGSNMYWTDGKALIIRRLKLFFKKYGKYSYKDIETATRNYVQSFNGDYTLMRTLRYFILKEVKGENGEIEGTSDLLNCLENKEQVEERGGNWVDRLV